MDDMELDPVLAHSLILARQNNAAWLLLSARRGPLMLASLKPLFERGVAEIPQEDAREQLARILATHANDPAFEIDTADFRALARKELREWIKRGLLVERGGAILATDSLQAAFGFLESITGRVMTTTASRLATVQQKIETLQANLNPDRESRAAFIRGKIAALEAELARVEEGEFEVLDGDRATEEIRELYSLAMSLRADFQRVGDSYREADRALRQAIIGDEQNRGEVVQKLLSTDDALLETPEGRVFDGFYRQVQHGTDLEVMRARLREILGNEASAQALDRRQAQDLRLLVSRLITESESVLRARSQGERDVKGFIKSGLAAENHRVGQLLQQIQETALDIDWRQQSIRRTPSPLPPVAPSLPSLPLPGRLCYKDIAEAQEDALNLEQQQGSLNDLEADFIACDDELDTLALYGKTLERLRESGHAHRLGELAQALPPEYDVETLIYWLSLAREAECVVGPDSEAFTLRDKANVESAFVAPVIALDPDAVATIDPEHLA
ncbi:DUF3375 domain-containing protein [Cerasicoccus frondis]|uniref:DUF3375 domain-containing protein n=1 Tax=Cerasicoccus frondis TaxID=490090 RepID=UPI0028529E21|nr:DUF3375 domain-containing protein [Cerasicoccus frondis]